MKTEARRQYEREWRRANPELVRARKQRYRTSGKARTTERALYARDPERARARRRAYVARHPNAPIEADTRWREKHPEAVRARVRNQRARRAGAPGAATVEQVAARVAYFGHLCHVCAGPYDEIDHVKPLAAGGSNWPANLRPICRGCNARKGASWIGVAA